jgi:hypothetical protein
MTDPSNIVPFGKYKGRLIEEVLADDPSYIDLHSPPCGVVREFERRL